MTVEPGDIYAAKGGAGPRYWLVVSLYKTVYDGRRVCLLGLDNLEDCNVVSAQTYNVETMERRPIVTKINLSEMRFEP